MKEFYIYILEKKKRALINGDLQMLKYLSKNSDAKYKEYNPSTGSG